MAKQMKTVTNIPGWISDFSRAGKLTSGPAAYAYVPLIYRCTRLIADSLSSVELKVYKGKGDNKVEVEWPFDLDVNDWVWKTTASILLTGASYSVKLKSVLGSNNLGLQWLNPTTVHPYLVDSQVMFKRSGMVAGGNVNEWSWDEMLYIREFNLSDDITPGISAAGVALTDAGLIRYLTRFASYYFEQGAMPLTLLPVPENIDKDEVNRLEEKFKAITTNIANAWRILAMRTGKDTGQPFNLTPPLRDLAMPQLHEQARRSCAAAFSIPQTMLEDAANYATSKDHTKQFWTTCVRPRGKQLESALNNGLFKQMGLSCAFAFEELDVFQEDESERAGSLKSLTDSGVPLLMAMDILGYDLDNDERAQLEKMANQPIELNTPAAQPTAPAAQPTAPVRSKPTPEAVRSALYYWKQAALTAIGKGKTPDFDTLDIEEHVADKIRAALTTCKTADDVHEVFKKARIWVKTPTAESQRVVFRYDTRPPNDELVRELKRANDLLEKELANAESTSKPA
jgi:HK97 family phage portal protein